MIVYFPMITLSCTSFFFSVAVVGSRRPLNTLAIALVTIQQTMVMNVAGIHDNYDTTINNHRQLTKKDKSEIVAYTLIVITIMLAILSICFYDRIFPDKTSIAPTRSSSRQRGDVDDDADDDDEHRGDDLDSNACALSKEERRQIRYQQIEQGLISKLVCSHDATCDYVRSLHQCHDSSKANGDCEIGLVDSSNISSNNSNNNTIDDLRHECPICMQAFQLNEIVSWGTHLSIAKSNPTSPMHDFSNESTVCSCQRYFHHHCIKEWLRKHDECPFCRHCFLPIWLCALQMKSTVNDVPSIAPTTSSSTDDGNNVSSSSNNDSSNDHMQSINVDVQSIAVLPIFPSEDVNNVTVSIPDDITIQSSELRKKGIQNSCLFCLQHGHVDLPPPSTWTNNNDITTELPNFVQQRLHESPSSTQIHSLRRYHGVLPKCASK
jgi:hypothetical protein